MIKRTIASLLAASLAACSPNSSDPRAAAGKWPPADYAAFTARPPMSVGAELEDPWTMAIEAERWSYQIGVAIVAAGGTPPENTSTPPATSDYLPRATRGLRNAGIRLTALHRRTCGIPAIAKAQDCAAFAPPTPIAEGSSLSKDEVLSRLQWFEANALQFVLPACAIAIGRTGDKRYCAVE
jgi:hypothetical protein